MGILEKTRAVVTNDWQGKEDIAAQVGEPLINVMRALRRLEQNGEAESENFERSWKSHSSVPVASPSDLPTQ